MSTDIDEQQLRRAHELVCYWLRDFVVGDKKCFKLDEGEGHRDLGPQVRRYILAMQHVRDNVESLLASPRDTYKRTMVVYDLEKLDELDRNASRILMYFYEFWNEGTWYNILGILQDMKRAVGIPVTSNVKSVVRTSEMAHFNDHENEHNVGLRILLTKLQAAV